MSRAATILLAVPGCVAVLWMARDRLPQSVREKVCPPCAAARAALAAETIDPAHAPRSSAVLAVLGEPTWGPGCALLAAAVIVNPAVVVPDEPAFHAALRRDVVRVATDRLKGGLSDADHEPLINAIAASLEHGTPQWRMVAMTALTDFGLQHNLRLRSTLAVVANAEPAFVATTARQMLARDSTPP